MNGKPDSFPCRLERAGSSGLSGDTLLNGEKQSRISGDWTGNNDSNNNTNSNNNNITFTRNTYITISTPPPPAIREISRTPTEFLNAKIEMPALHYAAEVGNEVEVDRILKGWYAESLTSKRMRDVGEKDKQRGMNPLHYAAKRGNQTIVRLILSYHAERARFESHSRTKKKGKQLPKNIPEATPPIKPEDAIKLLLASKSKEHGRDALHYAAAGGHDDVARVLLKAGADIKAKCSRAGMNPVHYAAALGHINILCLLKSYLDGQENITGKHPLSSAPEGNAANSMPNTRDNWEIVQPRRNRKGRHSKSNPEVNNEQKAALKDMLKAKSKRDGMTPLHFAATNGRNTAVEFLIEYGASTNVGCDWNEMEPIHYAAKHGHATTAQILHDRGADINAVSGRERMAPLHYAAQMGHETVVKFLCDNNADFRARCRWCRMTPLHYAAKHGHEVIVRMLVLYHEPSTPLKDRHRRTAIEYAEENGSESIAHFLNHYSRG